MTDFPCQLSAIASCITSPNRPSIQCKKRMSNILTRVKLGVRHIFLLYHASSGIAVTCGQAYCSVGQLYFKVLVVLIQTHVGPWRYMGKLAVAPDCWREWFSPLLPAVLPLARHFSPASSVLVLGVCLLVHCQLPLPTN